MMKNLSSYRIWIMGRVSSAI